MISLDTETTGLDFWHGARPYFVTSCDSARVDARGNPVPQFWEWDVDPETRRVDALEEDLQEIDDLVGRADVVVGQNVKFDVHALGTLWPPFRESGDGGWPWRKTADTLVAAHLLSSNTPHDLTSLAVRWLGINVEPLEKRLEECTQAARRWCRSHLPTWAVAKAGRPDMPSAKDKTWKVDAWLPRTLRNLEHHGPPEWDRVLADYANADSATTLRLWQVLEQELRRQDLREIFAERMRITPVIWGMEQRGVTLSKSRLDGLRTERRAEGERAAREMVEIAAGRMYDLKLPKSGNNQSLTWFAFEELGLPVAERTESGAPSLAKSAIAGWLDSLPPDGDQRRFVEALEAKRKADTSVSYLDGYERFWLGDGDVRVLHSSLNQTGTDTLRMSMQNPNMQNVDKRPDARGASLRKAFGPRPDREWWKIDYENIELRIPAFTAPEPGLIDVFLRPNDPPYFGSYHLAVFDVLHPEKFREHGRKCKDVYESTWYQWVKNGNFAVLYGAQQKQADRTFRVPGAYARIRDRFPAMARYSDRVAASANRLGFVETLPDRTVNPRRGYPIMCPRGDRGGVTPTVPLNYHVQSTAMWCTARAMVRCQEQLDAWAEDGFDAWMVVQVHDEIVFDFPAGGRKHLPRVRKLVQLMEESGDDVGVPLVAAAKWCPEHWGKTEELTCPDRVPAASRGR